ncbi:MAG: PTS system glucose-specific EIICBA component [Firmicutes bacterium]|nr:PTS system glucose-specific EIICBA component [Bacillota bacterium]
MKWREVMQRTARALMVPIVVLPVGAVLMAIGRFGPGFFGAAGAAIIIEYLPLMFAMGVAMGFTNYDGMAAFAAALGHVVLVAVMVAINPGVTLESGRIIPNEMSVLGGIMVGAYTATLYYRFRNVRLPEYLGFFSGKRFVVLVTAVSSVAIGFVLGHAWPPVNTYILGVGAWIFSTGGYGIFAYGVLNRLLIPTGLHHILANLIEHVFGAYVTPAGSLVTGEVARFMAGDPTAGYFTGGLFVTKLFALPAAALAILHEARAENRMQVAGLMLTAALTSIMVGITEPIEFVFIFTAPLLFAIHALLTGTVCLAAFLLGIRHYGYALPMFFINLAPAANPWLIFPLGLIYAAIYYFTFRFIIRKFNYPTPGRDVAEVKAATPADVNAVKGASPVETEVARRVIDALGGATNLLDVAACMSRLRVSVLNAQAVDEAKLSALPLAGVARTDARNLQLVMGTGSEQIREKMSEIIGGAKLYTLLAPLDGEVIPLRDVPDPAFAQELLGFGIGIIPSGNLLVAPTAGEVAKIFPGGHAVVLRTEQGLEILLHLGIDTVALRGEGFEILCAEGALVAQGQALIRFEREVILRAGKTLHSVLTIMNKEMTAEHQAAQGGQVTRGKSPVLAWRST